MATIELRDLNPAEFDNNLIVYSKIGIGIDSPSYHLHIKETTTTNTYFFAENTTAGFKSLNSIVAIFKFF